MFDADGGCDSAVTARVRSAWKKFREYLPILTGKEFLLKLKGKVYATCVNFEVSGFGCGCRDCRYFLTSGYFRYILTSDIGSLSIGPEPCSSVSAGISTSGRNSTSGLNSTSGSMFISRPPLVCDPVTMAEDGPAPGRVTAGIAAVAGAAGTESDLPDRSVQPTLRSGSGSISVTGNY